MRALLVCCALLIGAPVLAKGHVKVKVKGGGVKVKVKGHHHRGKVKVKL
jgi:hypothetical protein